MAHAGDDENCDNENYLGRVCRYNHIKCCSLAKDTGHGYNETQNIKFRSENDTANVSLRRNSTVEEKTHDQVFEVKYFMPNFGYEPYWEKSKHNNRETLKREPKKGKSSCDEDCPKELDKEIIICAVSSQDNSHREFNSLCEFNKMNCGSAAYYIAYLAKCDNEPMILNLDRSPIVQKADHLANQWYGISQKYTTQTVLEFYSTKDWLKVTPKDQLLRYLP